jgi:hypothetical protein
MRLFQLWSLAAAMLLSIVAIQPAKAVTECESRIDKIFVGDGHTLYIFLANHGVGVVPPSDTSQQTYLAMTTAALVAGRGIRVRYTADNVDCTTWRNDVAGVWLL